MGYLTISLWLGHCCAFCLPLQLSVGLTVSPYVVTPQNPNEKISGFEVDIVRESLGQKGYEVQFILQPLKRTKLSFKEKKVDGVLTVKKHYPQVKGAFFSHDYITYHNFALTLACNNFKINSVKDLAEKEIIAFQQAKFALGKEFQAMVTENPGYKEIASQKSQIGMFYHKRTEVIIIDDCIFKYYKIKLKNIPTHRAVTFHDIFKPSSYKIAFREKGIRNAFNEGLKELKNSGRYLHIIQSYTEHHPPAEKRNPFAGN